MIDIIKEREEIYKMMHDKWYELGDEEMIRYYEIKLSTIQGLLVEINEKEKKWTIQIYGTKQKIAQKKIII